MDITPTPIATNGFSNFNDALYQLLKPLEGDIPFVYSDAKGIPTLGIGYALVVDTGQAPPDKWALRDTYPAELLAANIQLTPTQLADLNTKLTVAMNALNGTGAVNPFSPYYPATVRNNPLGWTIDTTQSKSLFDFVVPEYETRVKNWLGNDTLYTSLQGSMEMAALFSMSFNGLINTGKSPTLRADILAGDRAEAWYQIRYQSNGGAGTLAYRRYAEAAVFGLYPTDASGNVVMNDDVARATYRMFTQHELKGSASHYILNKNYWGRSPIEFTA